LEALGSQFILRVLGETLSLDSNVPIHHVMSGATIHRVDGQVIYASKGDRIFRSEDGGTIWKEDGVIGMHAWQRKMAGIPLLKRMSRGGVFSVLPFGDGTRLCIGRKTILRAEAESTSYRESQRIPKGSRPLNLCLLPNGNIYWGEYFLNLKRSEPIRIFGSKDGGRNWEVTYTFSKGSICHIHRIVYDSYDDAILVCTGDRDHEVAILKTTDGFHTLTSLVQGDQRYRTTSLIPLPEYILYGTDNPGGENYIMALDRRTGSVEKLQKVPGPVLYGSRVGEHTIFATMVEKQHHEASLWCGNGNGFSMVAFFKAKKWNRPLRELMGYPTAILPEGNSDWPYLYFTPVGTESDDGSLMRMDLSGALNKSA
jgi:hypothetical protein